MFGESKLIIFGHRFIESESFYHIPNIDAIQNTPPSSSIYVEFSEENLDIINHADENRIILALGVDNITEIIYASSLGASYIVVSKKLAKTAQNIANEYLFDAKILVHINEENEIEELAILGIDGVVFQEGILKVNS